MNPEQKEFFRILGWDSEKKVVNLASGSSVVRAIRGATNWPELNRWGHLVLVLLVLKLEYYRFRNVLKFQAAASVLLNSEKEGKYLLELAQAGKLTVEDIELAAKYAANRGQPGAFSGNALQRAYLVAHPNESNEEAANYRRGALWLAQVVFEVQTPSTCDATVLALKKLTMTSK